MDRNTKFASGVAAVVLMLPVQATKSQAPGPQPNLCAHPTSLGEARVQKVCARVKFIGHSTFSGLGLIPAQLDIRNAIGAQATGRDALAQPRSFFSYDGVVITIPSSNRHDLDLVLRTAAAIEHLKATSRPAYDFIFAPQVFPTAPTMPNTQWKNRASRLFVSFDKTPVAIAASVTLLGDATEDNGVSHYSNYDLISIDEETIQGADATMGSRRIYKSTVPTENYRRFMEDGLLFSLVHEAVHRYIDYRNSTSRLANSLYNSRSVDNSAEEIVANETAMRLLAGQLSAEMRAEVANENAALVAKPGVRSALATLAGIRVEAHMPLVVPD